MKLPGQERFENLVATAVRVWLIIGILLRVTRLRDRVDGLSTLFYSTPWPFIAFGFVLLTLHSWRRGRGHATRRYVAFTLVALGTWVATSWYSTPAIEGVPAIRLVHWNVAYPGTRLSSCAAWIRRQNPDIVCLSEAKLKKTSALQRWRAEFPGYVVQEGPEFMLCLVRGQVLAGERGLLATGGAFASHKVRVGGRDVNVLQVDFSARATRSRRASAARLVELANAHDDGNLIIAGDFNMPRESAHLDPLRADFKHAFETAGRGLAETWPVPVPALSLDQVWVGRRWRVLDCTQGLTWLSDHRPVVVTIAGE